ncbi:MAG: D-glycero-alpha-D-manno-heptose-1,7-bisphosphate 7-phosphatase [Candidatus Acidiferrales bacterium]
MHREQSKKRVALLDRDGVINRRVAGGYVTSWDQFEFLPGALEGLRLLAESGYTILVLSNQAAVGEGMLSEETLARMTQKFVAQAAEHGGRISGVYYCTHSKSAQCECRKPRAGLFLRAQREHGFDFSESFFIGDSLTDARAAEAAGCPFVRVACQDFSAADWVPHSGRGTAPGLLEAVKFVLALTREEVAIVEVS